MGKVLARTEGAAYLNEPDNEYELFALRAKRRLGSVPVLAPGDEAPRYETLWRNAFGMVDRSAVRRTGRRIRTRVIDSLDVADEGLAVAKSRTVHRSPALKIAETIAVPRHPQEPYEHVIVKSVHCLLSLEWVVARFHPATLVVLRHPLNVIGSWMDLGVKARDQRLDSNPKVVETFAIGWGVSLPGAAASDVERAAWHYGLYATALQDACDRHPEWLTVQHEDLCAAPEDGFRSIADALGLRWTEATSAWLAESDRPGEGFATQRVASEQPERWRSRLDDVQVGQIRAVLEKFPLRGWPNGSVEP